MEEYLGYWNIPNVSKKKIQGILRIDDKKIELELVGDNKDFLLFYGFDESSKNNDFYEIDIELITGCGKSSQEKYDSKFTLYKPSSFKYRRSLLIAINYESIYLIKNKEINSLTNFKIQEVFFKYDHLDHWVGKFGYKIDNHRDRKRFEVTVNFLPPESIALYENSKYKMYLFYRASAPAFSNNQSELKLIQTAFFNIKFKNRQQFEEIVRIGKVIRDFFSFALSTPVGINKFEFKNYSKSAEKRNKISSNNIAEVTHRDHLTSKISKIYSRALLISYDDLSKSRLNVIETWMEKYELLSPVMKLYFDNLYNENIYYETGFLNYIFALEVYHKRAINDKKEDLKKRLEYLLKKYSRITSKMIKNRTSFLNKVVGSRNYFVHYNTKIRKQNILKEKEMFISTLKLKILIQIILLDELGYDVDYIEQRVTNDVNNYWAFNDI